MPVVARTHTEIRHIQTRLEGLGLATMEIKPNQPETQNEDAIKLATVHRVKGLEFDPLILASANAELVPLASVLEGKADRLGLANAETEEWCLACVAMTRARIAAYVLIYGQPSSFFWPIRMRKLSHEKC